MLGDNHHGLLTAAINVLAVAAGLAGLVASAYLGAAGLQLQPVVGIGLVAVASIWLGHAWGRLGYAPLLIVPLMLAGEGYNLTSALERALQDREARQAPIKGQRDRHEAATQRLAKAEALAAQPLPATSARLQAAEAAKARVEAQAALSASERGCRDTCAAMFAAQRTSAQSEIDAARGEVALQQLDAKASIAVELSAARADLAANPPPASASPLADKLGMTDTALSLILAGLLSLSTTGLSSALLAFGAHRLFTSRLVSTQRGAEQQVATAAPTFEAALAVPQAPLQLEPPTAVPAAPAEPIARSIGSPRVRVQPRVVASAAEAHRGNAMPAQPAATRPDATATKRGPVGTFFVQSMRKAPGASADMHSVYAVYREWCGENGHTPAEPADFVEHIKVFCEHAAPRIASRRSGTTVLLLDVALSRSNTVVPLRRASGR